MILKKINNKELHARAQKALTKKLKGMKNYTQKLSIDLDLKDLFTIEKLPIVFINKTAQEKMNALVETCNLEIGWHGLVKKEIDDEGIDVYTIYDILVYPQEITAATTEATDDVGMWYMNLPDEQFNNLRMQGHSHVNMHTSPSGVDTNYYEQLIEGVKDYYIFMILNKRDEFWIELHDVENGIVFEKRDLIVDFEEDVANTWAELQIDTHLSKKKTNKVVGPGYDTGGLQRYNKNYLGYQQQYDEFNMDNYRVKGRY